MSLLTMNDSFVNDSSTRRLLFFGENLADGGGLFRREVRHANVEGTAVHLRHDLRTPLQCKGFLSGLTGLTTQQASRVETWNPLTE